MGRGFIFSPELESRGTGDSSSRREQQKERHNEDHGHNVDDETRPGVFRLTVNHDQEDNQDGIRTGNHRIEFEE